MIGIMIGRSHKITTIVQTNLTEHNINDFLKKLSSKLRDFSDVVVFNTENKDIPTRINKSNSNDS